MVRKPFTKIGICITSPLGAPNTGSWTKITANETGEVTLDVSLNTGSVDARLVGMVMNSDRTDIVSDNGWEVLRSGKGSTSFTLMLWPERNIISTQRECDL